MITFSTTWQDYPDRESLAVIVYIPGCKHNCKGCHNPDLIEPEDLVNPNVIDELDVMLKSNKTDKVVLSGGDPLFNRDIAYVILDYCNRMGHKVCIYTGYTYKEAVKRICGNSFNFLKCGRYEDHRRQDAGKDMEKFVLASTNQELYDGTGKLLSSNGVYYFGNTKE
jgi:pyruvate-formate lyase-activating enzyme